MRGHRAGVWSGLGETICRFSWCLSHNQPPLQRDVTLKAQEPEVHVIMLLSLSSIREMLTMSPAWVVTSHPTPCCANSPLHLGWGQTTVWACGRINSVGSVCSSRIRSLVVPLGWCSLRARHGAPVLSRSSLRPLSRLYHSYPVSLLMLAGELYALKCWAVPVIPAPKRISFFRRAYASHISAGLLFSQWWRLLCSCSPCVSGPLFRLLVCWQLIQWFFLLIGWVGLCPGSHREGRYQWGNTADQIILKFVSKLAVSLCFFYSKVDGRPACCISVLHNYKSAKTAESNS